MIQLPMSRKLTRIMVLVLSLGLVAVPTSIFDSALLALRRKAISTDEN